MARTKQTARKSKAPRKQLATKAARKAIAPPPTTGHNHYDDHNNSSNATPNNNYNKRSNAVVSSTSTPSAPAAKKAKIVTPASGNGGRCCAVCNVVKELQCFSKNQRKKGNEAKCKDCTGTALPPQKKSKPKKARQQLCVTCKQQKIREEFSVSQWSGNQRDDERQCMECFPPEEELKQREEENRRREEEWERHKKEIAEREKKSKERMKELDVRFYEHLDNAKCRLKFKPKNKEISVDNFIDNTYDILYVVTDGEDLAFNRTVKGKLVFTLAEDSDESGRKRLEGKITFDPKHLEAAGPTSPMTFGNFTIVSEDNSGATDDYSVVDFKVTEGTDYDEVRIMIEEGVDVNLKIVDNRAALGLKVFEHFDEEHEQDIKIHSIEEGEHIANKAAADDDSKPNVFFIEKGDLYIDVEWDDCQRQRLIARRCTTASHTSASVF